jgi:predicted membrane protein
VGAARFEAEGLGNLNCEDLSFSGGVGDVALDFTGNWRTDGTVDIDMGLGSLTLRLPKGLGVSVHKSSVLASFDSQGLIKRGQVYYSEGFDKADRKLNINIDAALGSIKVLWVESRN